MRLETIGIIRINMLCLYDEVISGVKVHLSLIASLGLSTISMFVVFYFFLPQEN